LRENRVWPSISSQWGYVWPVSNFAGLLTWRSPQASRRNQKRRELLVGALERFFRIDRDPFVPCGNGWRALFPIEAESAGV